MAAWRGISVPPASMTLLAATTTCVTNTARALAGSVLHRARLGSMPFIAWRAFSKHARVANHRQITGLDQMSELTVRSTDGRPLPLQVDGDYLGEVTEARYSIMPGALNVVC